MHLAGLGKSRGGGLFETKDGLAQKFLELRYESQSKSIEAEQGEAKDKLSQNGSHQSILKKESTVLSKNESLRTDERNSDLKSISVELGVRKPPTYVKFDEQTGLKALFEYKDYVMEHNFSEEQMANAGVSGSKSKFVKARSVVAGQKVLHYNVQKNIDRMVAEKDIRDTHIRNHKNFKPSNLSLEKSVHPVDNESAYNIVHNLKVNKKELRDKKGNKVIKLPFASGENDRQEAFQIYPGLRDKFMTEEEKTQQAAKVTKYLKAKRILQALTKQESRESIDVVNILSPRNKNEQSAEENSNGSHNLSESEEKQDQDKAIEIKFSKDEDPRFLLQNFRNNPERAYKVFEN